MSFSKIAMRTHRAGADTTRINQLYRELGQIARSTAATFVVFVSFETIYPYLTSQEGIDGTVYVLINVLTASYGTPKMKSEITVACRNKHA
jgi:hypothetical protein